MHASYVVFRDGCLLHVSLFCKSCSAVVLSCVLTYLSPVRSILVPFLLILIKAKFSYCSTYFFPSLLRLTLMLSSCPPHLLFFARVCLSNPLIRPEPEGAGGGGGVELGSGVFSRVINVTPPTSTVDCQTAYLEEHCQLLLKETQLLSGELETVRSTCRGLASQLEDRGREQDLSQHLQNKVSGRFPDFKVIYVCNYFKTKTMLHIRDLKRGVKGGRDLKR
jgi:hypothetical protein